MSITMSEQEFLKLLSQVEKITWPENAEKSHEELVSDIGNHLLKVFGYDNGCLMIFSRDFDRIHDDYYFGNDVSNLRECRADVTTLMKETGDKPGSFPDVDTILSWRGGKYQVHDYISIPVHPTPDVTGVLALMDFCAKEKSQENAEYFQIRNYIVLYCIASLFTDRMVARQLEANVKRLQADLAKTQETIIYRSPKMKAVIKKAARVAQSNSTILVLGESGVGKELLAQYIHATSGRPKFVATNITALSDQLLESELFGHEKGAFTGATSRHIGKFERANGGTLFLDEIGDIPKSTQVKLLRVLQEREFERVGGEQIIKVDVRLITATNQDLKKEREEGRFREDLYYRINVVPITIPPLREREEDIPLLIAFFRDKYGKANNKPNLRLSPETIRLLENYDWPGNVRELENVIERLVVEGTDEVIYSDALPEEIKSKRLTPQNSQGTNDPDKLNRDTRLERAHEYVREKGQITNKAYRELFNKKISDETARTDLNSLVERKLVVLKGQGRGVYYELARGDSRTTDK
ncbi:sigma-54-dependent Fis family transcriptional regulator [Candidatus Poribacteria bacterium]|nr:sigma-54-dependent Fis family transcriptional regulator [Candidatus Poribacteria bacterium]